MYMGRMVLGGYAFAGSVRRVTRAGELGLPLFGGDAPLHPRAEGLPQRDSESPGRIYRKLLRLFFENTQRKYHIIILLKISIVR